MVIITRQKEVIWLIEFALDEISEMQLLWRESLKRYFKLHRDGKTTMREAVRITVREVFHERNKARIPTVEEKNARSLKRDNRKVD